MAEEKGNPACSGAVPTERRDDAAPPPIFEDDERMPLPGWLAVRQSNDRWTLGLCLFAIIMATILTTTPDREGVSLLGYRVPESCGTRLTSGLPCPGCGMTRSFVSMARGDIATALDLHPLGPIFFILAALQIPLRATRLYQTRQRQLDLAEPYQTPGLDLCGLWLGRVLVGALLVVGTMRLLQLPSS